MTETAHDYIGRGVPFPLRVDQTGAIALTSGAEDIVRAMRMILGTAPGERVMRPDFGCRIWDMIFEPVDVTTIGRIKSAVADALARWDPRITVNAIDVVPSPKEYNRLDIHIAYTVNVSNDERNLVYPFYVIPREEG